MGTNVRQGIVTSGLTLHIDAANSLCYPSTGTTVTSLVRDNVTGSLSGSQLTYTKNNGGSFNMNNPATGQVGFITLSSDVFSVGANPYTVELVLNTPAYIGGSRYCVLGNARASSSPGLIGNFLVFINGDAQPSPGITQYSSAGAAGAYLFTPYRIPTNTWLHICITATRGAGQSSLLYVNNQVVATGLNPTGISTATSGSAIFGQANGVSSFNGQIAITRFYNRALSATEVRQNYNAVKSRFNLP